MKMLDNAYEQIYCQMEEEPASSTRRVAKFIQESIFVAFDFIWKVLLSIRNFAIFL